MVERYEMIDVGFLLVLREKVTECVNIFYIHRFVVDYSKRDSSSARNDTFGGGPLPALVGGYSRKTDSRE